MVSRDSPKPGGLTTMHGLRSRSLLFGVLIRRRPMRSADRIRVVAFSSSWGGGVYAVGRPAAAHPSPKLLALAFVRL